MQELEQEMNSTSAKQTRLFLFSKHMRVQKAKTPVLEAAVDGTAPESTPRPNDVNSFSLKLTEKEFGPPTIHVICYEQIIRLDILAFTVIEKERNPFIHEEQTKVIHLCNYIKT